MLFNDFVRIPFTVSAVEVTEENLPEIAELIGSLATKEDGTPYVKVDNKIVPNVYRVFPGFWITKMGDNIRAYSPKVFKQQFVEGAEEILTWVAYLEGIAAAQVPAD